MNAFDETQGLKERTLAGLGWTAGSRVLQQAIQFATTVLLARTLVPEDFGLVGLIVVLTGFATVLLDFGFAAALIQRDRIEERHLSSAFWLNLATGLGLTLLVVLLAPALASFYDEPRLETVTMVLGASFTLTALGIVQVALLQRRMHFRRLAIIENTATLAAGCTAVGVALAGYGVWSLVVLTLTSTLLRSALLWLLSDWRPHPRIDLQAIRDIWSFSVNLAGVHAINYWSRNADNFLIGKFIGPIALGLYGRAYNTMLLPVTLVQAITGRVMFPALSKLQADRERVRRVYLRSLALIALFTFPVTIGLLAASESFILALYGPKWTDVVPILQVLCIPALTQSISTTVGWIYLSQGRTDWMFRLNLLALPFTIGAFAIGLMWGVLGVATAYAIRTLLLTYFTFSIPGRLIDMTFLDVVRTLRGLFAIAAMMGVVVWAAGLALPSEWPAGVQLIIEAAVGISSYLALLHLFSPRAYVDLKGIMAEQRGRRRIAKADRREAQTMQSS